MNIFIHAGSLSRTQAGAAHATRAIANAFAAKTAHTVYLYASEYDPGTLHPAIQVIGYARQPRWPGVWRFRHAIEVRQYAAQLRRSALPHVDVCYTQGLTWGLAFRRVLPRVPVISHTGWVISERERIEEFGGDSCPWYVRADAKLLARLERGAYRQPRWAHVVSTRTVAEQRSAYFGIPESTFTVCPFGLDPDVFDGARSDGRVRERLGIPADAPVLITVSRLTQLKNTDVLLKAFARCGVEHAYCIVAGDGVERLRLEALVEALGIAGRVRFTGHVEPAPYYAASDVFALPSKIESFGLVYGEAMLMRLPCIGLKNAPPDVLSAAQDVICDGETGFCVSSEDELTDRLAFLLRDTAARHRMGAAGCARARRLYSHASYVRAMLDVARDRFGLDA